MNQANQVSDPKVTIIHHDHRGQDILFVRLGEPSIADVAVFLIKQALREREIGRPFLLPLEMNVITTNYLGFNVTLKIEMMSGVDRVDSK